jgi:hypothetical protein
MNFSLNVDFKKRIANIEIKIASAKFTSNLTVDAQERMKNDKTIHARKEVLPHLKAA